jgi:acyl carrier protein
MLGGWLLHRLLKDAPLDFFVGFSSAGSLMGQPGQGNYAAGNAFVDALIHHRKALGRPALSINWGPWRGLGFAETDGGRRLTRRLAMMGIGSMPPRRALEVMTRIMHENATQVWAIPVNWRQYRELFAAGAEPVLLSGLVNEAAAGTSQKVHPREKRQTILGAEPGQRGQLIEVYVIEQVARVLGVSAPQLDIGQPLTNLGFDSLMAVELKNRISADLGIDVPMVNFLQGFSVGQAATQLLAQLITEADSASEPRPSMHAAGETLSTNIDELSDDQVNAILTEMLSKNAVAQ